MADHKTICLEFLTPTVLLKQRVFFKEKDSPTTPSCSGQDLFLVLRIGTSPAGGSLQSQFRLRVLNVMASTQGIKYTVWDCSSKTTSQSKDQTVFSLYIKKNLFASISKIGRIHEGVFGTVATGIYRS